MIVRNTINMTINYKFAGIHITNLPLLVKIKYHVSDDKTVMHDISVSSVSKKTLRPIFSTKFINENMVHFRKIVNDSVKAHKKDEIKAYNEQVLKLRDMIDKNFEQIKRYREEDEKYREEDEKAIDDVKTEEQHEDN